MNFHRIKRRWLLHSSRYVKSIALFFMSVFFPLFLFGQTNNTPLEKMLLKIETEYAVSISYNADLLKKVTVSNSDITGLPIEAALVKLLRNTYWQFEIISDKYVIIKEAAPDFFTQYSHSYCGKVLDENSHEALISANIQIKNEQIGCSTNESGQFTLEAAYVPNDSIVISYLGYQSKIIPVSYLKKQQCPPIYLKIASNKLRPVIVKIQKDEPDFMESETNSARQFNVQKIDWIGGQVEKDVFQIIQVLPGISTGKESATDIHIRGGGSGQNLVLYDGITLYHFGHFFGKVAAVNPLFAEKVSLFKEGVPTQYGGRIAGVIDIKSKEKIPDKLETTAELNLLSGNISFHLPTFKKKGHLLLTYRRSLTDVAKNIYFKKVFDQIFQNSRISSDKEYVRADSIEDISSLIPVTNFKDFSAKWNINLTSKDEWSMSYTNMKDALFYDYKEGNWYQSTDTLEIDNEGLSIIGRHRWLGDNYLQTSFSYSKLNSRYLYLAELQDTVNVYAAGNQNQLKDYAFRLYNRWGSKKNTLDVGYQFNLIQEGYSIFERSPVAGNSSALSDSTQGQTYSLYFDYHFDLPKLIHFNLGLRSSFYDLTSKIYLEPRFFVKVHPKPNWTIKVASGIYYQTINQIVEYNELNSEAKLWLLSRNTDEDGRIYFSVVRNTQYSFGITHNYKTWRFNLSFYQKSLTGVTSRTIKFNEDFPWSTGNMEAKGLEFNLQKRTKKVSTLLSYTLSSAIYDFDYLDYLVPASYDQRHSFNWVQGFKYKNFTLSSFVKWNTGTPFPEGAQRLMDDSNPNDISYWLEFKHYNGNRLPYYLRWDMNLTWAFEIKKTKGRLTLAGLNLLNRRNILQRNFKLKYPNGSEDPPQVIEINKYGIPFTPNVGISFEF